MTNMMERSVFDKGNVLPLKSNGLALAVMSMASCAFISFTSPSAYIRRG